ncbi:hypothetical protein CLV35_0159 [Motilibacter peucedani]|uniref:Uncharacterized protein n=1 Tax=Motilibacter peucedani TaxID=598650 RepID=A0A420XV16_9ACTN|nr:hypothetical protein [Motilibacter peucedani]RKS80693.1 hypothetical protein CLV35_0159 [Motilibacter peucedani]
MATTSRPAAARTATAATAATITMSAAVVLLVSALGLYHWAGAGSDLIMRDVVLATLLGLCAVGNLVAPLRARRSATGALVVAVVLLVATALEDSDGDRFARVVWVQVGVGGVALLCALTTLAATARSAHAHRDAHGS